jgi:hypothetical protein
MIIQYIKAYFFIDEVTLSYEKVTARSCTDHFIDEVTLHVVVPIILSDHARETDIVRESYSILNEKNLETPSGSTKTHLYYLKRRRVLRIPPPSSFRSSHMFPFNHQRPHRMGQAQPKHSQPMPIQAHDFFSGYVLIKNTLHRSQK